MHISIQTVTPKMAEALLESNTNNRSVSDGKVKEYAREMLNGNWKLTHQGISVADDGTLLDGQHRLHAIVRSGIPIQMPVATGVAKDSSFAIDQLRPRSKSDAIKIGGLNESLRAKEVAMINSMMNMFHGIKTSTASEIAKFAEENEDAVSFIQRNFTSNKRGVGSASVKIAFFCAFLFESESKLKEIIDILYSGITSDAKNSYVIRFRDEIMRSTSSGRTGMIERTKRTMRVIHAFCRDESIKRITTPSEFIYPAPEAF